MGGGEAPVVRGDGEHRELSHRGPLPRRRAGRAAGREVAGEGNDAEPTRLATARPRAVRGDGAEGELPRLSPDRDAAHGPRGLRLARRDPEAARTAPRGDRRDGEPVMAGETFGRDWLPPNVPSGIFRTLRAPSAEYPAA